jgi:hypothetical protein
MRKVITVMIMADIIIRTKTMTMREIMVMAAIMKFT